MAIKFFYCACAVTVVLSSFSACEDDQIYGGYTHPEFQTEYTIEEHIERIEKRMQEKFAEQIQSGEISDIEVEILYAFHDNDPEYFMVQLEYADEVLEVRQINEEGSLEVQRSRYKHFIGFIENDKYYSGLYGYDSNDDVFIVGRNAYELCGYSEAKKYYGCRIQAVETQEGILRIFDMPLDTEVEFSTDEKRFEACLVPEEKYEYYMKSNFKLFRRIY